MSDPAAPPRVSCAHCDLPVPAGLVAEEGPSFCCHACAQVHAILGELGLEQYYTLRDRLPGEKKRAVRRDRSYAEFDDETFERLYVRTLPSGARRIELFLEGVHCAACIWLVERVPQLLEGVLSTRLDLGRARAIIDYDPTCVRLSQIAARLDAIGYPPHPFRGGAGEAAARQERRDLWIRLAISGAVAGNVMMISFALYGGFFHGIDPTLHQVLRIVALGLSIPALIWGGGWFFRSAAQALRARRLHIDLPVSIGIIAGYLHGTWNVVRGEGELYLDSVTMLIFLLLGGRILERGQQRRAAEAAELLHAIAPSRVRRIDVEEAGTETENEVPVEALLPGARIRVRAGETIPADGVVRTGRSELDRSLLTGESRPVAVEVGTAVEAGCTNLTAALEVVVSSVGEESRIGKLLAAMEESAERRAPVVRLADRISGVFVAAVLTAAAITALMSWRIDPATAIDRTLALLIVTCPCALALATPLAVTAALGRAARRGILVRGGDVFERLRTPGVVWFDKTGTLTAGAIGRVDWQGDAELERAVAALERESGHPLAHAFLRALPPSATPPASADEVEPLPGGGLRGRVAGRAIVVGSPTAVLEHLGEDAAATPEGARLLEAARCAAAEGSTPVLVARDGALAGLALFRDALRNDAAETIATWRAHGWQVGILSGDDPAVARAVAAELGIPAERALGAITPEGKLAQVETDLAAGHATAMVGDGVNDAAALAAATVGVAIGGGAEAALRAADAFVLDRRLAGVAELVDGSRRVLTTICRNLGFSLLYNVIGASCAVTGLLSPIVAAVLMPLSSLTVLTISWRSRTFPPATLTEFSLAPSGGSIHTSATNEAPAGTEAIACP